MTIPYPGACQTMARIMIHGTAMGSFSQSISVPKIALMNPKFPLNTHRHMSETATPEQIYGTKKSTMNTFEPRHFLESSQLMPMAMESEISCAQAIQNVIPRDL